MFDTQMTDVIPAMISQQYLVIGLGKSWKTADTSEDLGGVNDG